MTVEVNPIFAVAMKMKKQLNQQLSDPSSEQSKQEKIFPEGHDSQRAK